MARNLALCHVTTMATMKSSSRNARRAGQRNTDIFDSGVSGSYIRIRWSKCAASRDTANSPNRYRSSLRTIAFTLYYKTACQASQTFFFACSSASLGQNSAIYGAHVGRLSLRNFWKTRRRVDPNPTHMARVKGYAAAACFTASVLKWVFDTYMDVATVPQASCLFQIDLNL